MRRALARLVVPLALAAGGCGFLVSGTWTDDPENASRAWGAPLPPGVTLVRSVYWRSPHFTREERYHFQLTPSAVFRDAFVSANALMEADTAGIAPLTQAHRPGWFLPKPAASYTCWTQGDPNPRAAVFEDRETGDLFLWAEQL